MVWIGCIGVVLGVVALAWEQTLPEASPWKLRVRAAGATLAAVGLGMVTCGAR